MNLLLRKKSFSKLFPTLQLSWIFPAKIVVFIFYEILNNHLLNSNSTIARLSDHITIVTSQEIWNSIFTIIIQNIHYNLNSQTSFAIYLTNYLNNSFKLLTLLLYNSIKSPLPPPPLPEKISKIFRGLKREHWEEMEFSECSKSKEYHWYHILTSKKVIFNIMLLEKNSTKPLLALEVYSKIHS